MQRLQETIITIKADGLCEPTNPGGYGCWGYVVIGADGSEVFSAFGCIGRGRNVTNNIAEYTAVREALKFAAKSCLVLQGAVLDVCTDSQLVVQQVTGEWECRAGHLLKLRDEVRELMAATNASLRWIPREENTRADGLTRQAYKAALRREGGRRNG